MSSCLHQGPKLLGGSPSKHHHQSQLKSPVRWYLQLLQISSPCWLQMLWENKSPGHPTSCCPQVHLFKFPGGASLQEALVFTWNIKGVHRSFSSLSSFSDSARPSLIFLSKPQAFLCNIGLFMEQLPSFKFFLNGEDCHLPDLPLQTIRAKGGTMALWVLLWTLTSPSYPPPQLLSSL